MQAREVQRQLQQQQRLQMVHFSSSHLAFVISLSMHQINSNIYMIEALCMQSLLMHAESADESAAAISDALGLDCRQWRCCSRSGCSRGRRQRCRCSCHRRCRRPPWRHWYIQSHAGPEYCRKPACAPLVKARMIGLLGAFS